MEALIDKYNFECVGEVAKHCDNEKLCIAIQEAQLFDLDPLLCALFDEVVANWNNISEPWNTLINGGSYEDCKGRTKTFLGIKRVLVYYSYARYLMLNGFNDTPNGMVQKTNNFSIPKPLKEVENFSDKYRSMGYKTWKQVERYLCLNKDLPEFEEFSSKNCKPCGCNDLCDSKTSVKGYGFKGKNISK